jgi:hypothetical protein
MRFMWAAIVIVGELPRTAAPPESLPDEGRVQKSAVCESGPLPERQANAVLPMLMHLWRQRMSPNRELSHPSPLDSDGYRLRSGSQATLVLSGRFKGCRTLSCLQIGGQFQKVIFRQALANHVFSLGPEFVGARAPHGGPCPAAASRTLSGHQCACQPDPRAQRSTTTPSAARTPAPSDNTKIGLISASARRSPS